MKLSVVIFTLVALLSSVAFAQPDDRDVTITIPGARLVSIQAICEEFRITVDPVPDTITLLQCMKGILFQELRQRNCALTRRQAIVDKYSDIDSFNQDVR